MVISLAKWMLQFVVGFQLPGWGPVPEGYLPGFQEYEEVVVISGGQEMQGWIALNQSEGTGHHPHQGTMHSKDIMVASDKPTNASPLKTQYVTLSQVSQEKPQTAPAWS